MEVRMLSMPVHIRHSPNDSDCEMPFQLSLPPSFALHILVLHMMRHPRVISGLLLASWLLGVCGRDMELNGGGYDTEL